MVIVHERVLQSGGGLCYGSSAGVGCLVGGVASGLVGWSLASRNLLVKRNNVFYDRASWQNTQPHHFSVSSKCENSVITKVKKGNTLKRYGNLFSKISHKQNILNAHNKAKKGKSEYSAVKYVEANLTSCIDEINEELENRTYETSDYEIDTRIERGKEREIYKLPYFKDRIVHHAILQVIEPILSETYIKDTYQSIKGRGVHKAKDRLKEFLKDTENTKYCLKIDIKKYYPNVDNTVLKTLIRKKIKCKDTLNLVDEIIDSTKGLPIGNYTSQTFGNYYLSYFDHWIKENKKIRYYIRYADDMVFLLDNKEDLHELKKDIDKYLYENLKLTLKENWQVFPTEIRGIDFLGFRFFHKYTMLRNSIKKAYMKVIKSIKKRGATLQNINSVMAYYGWLKASDSYNLLRATVSLIVKKFYFLCSKLKIKNPLDKIVLVPKKNINSFGNFQPSLF